MSKDIEAKWKQQKKIKKTVRNIERRARICFESLLKVL